LDVVEEAITRYKIGNTCVSFNGGKDCTALLYMVYMVVKKLCLDQPKDGIIAFYAKLPNHFEEESKFVDSTVQRYGLQLKCYSTKCLKESLLQLKKDLPNIEAIFIGTRQGDLKPGTKLGIFAPTDDEWPKFMRVNPILNWSYSQVWDFLREFDIPYCDLYNQGYSSLGTMNNTSKNSSLLVHDKEGRLHYLPAWKLARNHEERSSRSNSLDVTNKNS